MKNIKRDGIIEQIIYLVFFDGIYGYMPIDAVNGKVILE